jgi:translation elongation factor EF-Tu-like GTPase
LLRLGLATVAVLIACFSGAAEAPADEAGTIVVNAPDGPVPETREAMRKAQELGLSSVKLKLQNVDQIQDEELLQLITSELYELLEAYGFDEGEVTLERCPTLC